MRSCSPRTTTPRGLENSRNPSMPWCRPIPLFPEPPKPQRRQGTLHRTGVHTGATGCRPAEHLLDPAVVVPEHVQTERSLTVVDEVDGFIDGVVGLHRQQWPEDLLLGDAAFGTGVEDQRQRHAAGRAVGHAALLQLENLVTRVPG